MSAKDGGPAFPVTHESPSVYSGMSLRDYFAGQALAGELASWTESSPTPGSLAARCYEYADALLQAREAAE